MEKHFELSDEAFEWQFRNCTLDPDIFSHEAHLRLAWINIKKYGLDQALEGIQSQLKKFVDHVGAKDKYHATLTIGAIQAVNHFIKNSSSESFSDFILEFPELKVRFKELISSHYSFDIFNSEEAKNVYLEPDKMPF